MLPASMLSSNAIFDLIFIVTALAPTASPSLLAASLASAAARPASRAACRDARSASIAAVRGSSDQLRSDQWLYAATLPTPTAATNSSLQNMTNSSTPAVRCRSADRRPDRSCCLADTTGPSALFAPRPSSRHHQPSVERRLEPPLDRMR